MQLTEDEQHVLNKINEAHKAFAELQQQHPDDIRDFVNGVHIMQGLIMARVARRANPDMFPVYTTKVVKNT